jgi:cob(I)alamin adenosyltransferase
MTQPFVSIVVPTRDRPELLRYCLRSLVDQEFSDFEVIVSDNFKKTPARQVFDEIADPRFTYVTPPRSLAMHDNWEFAAEQAGGTYVAVLIDKTVLRPSALYTMHRVLSSMPAELVSWWNEGYNPVARTGYECGEYGPAFRPSAPVYFDTRDELKARFNMAVRRGEEGIRYYRGKICFGAYHRELIGRIKARIGRLFYPISPDYTSLVAALALASSAVDMGEPLLISFNVTLSTGYNNATNPASLKTFLSQIDPSFSVSHRMPIEGLYSSLHNCVALDYVQMRDRLLPELEKIRLNMSNLSLRAAEDLTMVSWTDDAERADQLEILDDFRRRHPLSNLPLPSSAELASVQENSRTIFRWAKRLAARALGERRTVMLKQSLNRICGLRFPVVAPYGNILEAARAAESYYRHTRR